MKKTNFYSFFIALFCLLPVFAQSAVITLPAGKTTVASYTDTDVTVPDKAELHLTSSTPLTNSTVNLQTEDSWLFFIDVKPSKVISDYLSSIKVNGQPFAVGTNGRVAIYGHGAVVMPHSSDFKPLTVYTGENYTGESKECEIHTYHNNLGTLDNAIKSFKLKRGYMATFATNSDGRGYSRVFTAHEADIEIPVMPEFLYETASFIRVFKFQWVSKKAYGGGVADAKILRATSHYNWSASASSDPDVEYVPHKHGGNGGNGGWPSFSDINNQQNVNSVMGLNEPDKTDQVNMTYDAVMAMQPQFYNSGFRVTSPCTSDFYNGWGQAAYINECVNERNYRIDVSNVHAYQKTGWWNAGRLTDISNKSAGRPLWITEWNNGCNWSWSESDQIWLANDSRVNSNLDAIKYIVGVMDAHPKVERYFMYQWCHYGFQMMITLDNSFKSSNPDWASYQWLKTAPVVGKDDGNNDIVLTPAGQWYRDHNAPLAYSSENEMIPTWVTQIPVITSSALKENNTIFEITLQANPGNELSKSYILEGRVDGGRYETIEEISNRPASNKLTASVDLSQPGTYSFRLRAKGVKDDLSEPGVETTYTVTSQDDISVGNAPITRTDWNAMYFGYSYSSVPSIILGTPGYNNPHALMTTRVQNAKKDQLSFKLETWRYLNQTSYTKAENLPYLVLPAGAYDLNGINAYVSDAIAQESWTTVSFRAPSGLFTEPPIVIPTQTSARNLPPTSIHIRNVTTTGFDICVRKEAGQSATTQYESVNYIALSTGEGVINGKKIYTGKVEDVGHTVALVKEFGWTEELENTRVFTHKQTANDNYASNTRLYAQLAKSARVINQIERSGSITDPAPATETVGWMVIGDMEGLSINAPTVDNSNALRFYPNPVTDYVYFDNQGEELSVRILNMQGAVIASKTTRDNKMDLSNLNNGLYIICINGKSAIIKKD